METSKAQPTLGIESMRVAAAAATRTLRTLANPDRLLLLCQLGQGERSVGELAAAVGVLQPTLSQQLGVLRSEGLVATRRDGKQIYYSVQDARVLELLGKLYELYCPHGGDK